MSDYNITLDKMKHYLSVRHNRDDALIESFIKVALADVQNAIDRRFDDPATWGFLNGVCRHEPESSSVATINSFLNGVCRHEHIN